MAFPLQPVGLVAASLYILASAALMARPVFGDGFRYKTRVPAGCFAVGAGMMLTILNVYVVGAVGVVEAAAVTFIGYLLMGVGALIGLHLCWFVIPTLYPELVAEDDDIDTNSDE